MYDWNSVVSYSSMGYNNTGLIVAIVVALIGTVIAAMYLFGPNKRGRLSGLMLKVYAHVNFQHFIIPSILKFLYVYSVLFAIINGLITMFSSSFIAGLAMVVVGPILIRVAYELIMMLFSIHDGIRETNRLLRGGARPQRDSAERYDRPIHRPRPDSGQQDAPPEQQKQYPGGYDPMHRG